VPFNPLLARPAYEDRVFDYLLTGQKGIGRVFPYSTRAPESSGGARVGTRPDQPELSQGASAGKCPILGDLCLCSRVSACTLHHVCKPAVLVLRWLRCSRYLRSGRCCCPFFQGWVKGHFLNFETGAGVKYKSSSAPACVISGRLIYPSSPSGQRSDFTNPNACVCSGSASFSVIYQSHEPVK